MLHTLLPIAWRISSCSRRAVTGVPPFVSVPIDIATSSHTSVDMSELTVLLSILLSLFAQYCRCCEAFSGLRNLSDVSATCAPYVPRLLFVAYHLNHLVCYTLGHASRRPDLQGV
jgi:hypothetical protein